MKLSQFFPPAQWLKGYQRSWIKGDVWAGLTVGVMFIPQGMAYGLLAGVPPIYGLYASVVALLVYTLLGTSRQLSVGPVAITSLLTAAGITSVYSGGIEGYITLAIVLALFVGVIQLSFGVFRLGFLVNFLSYPVISGFTSAAALIIGFSQLKYLLGIPIPRSNHIDQVLLDAIQMSDQINFISLSVGIGGIVLIALFKRYLPNIPGTLVAVVLGIIVAWVFKLEQYGLEVVGEVPDGLPSFRMPQIETSHFKSLLPISLTIAMVSIMQSVAAAKVMQIKHGDYQINPNQEFVSIGMANIATSFFQGFPVAGGFARTAVNDQTGAKTSISSLISAGLIILTLLFFTPVFYFLPNAILASVIMFAAAGLLNFSAAKQLWKTHRTDFWLMISTFLATLILGIEEGIGVGVALSLVMVIQRSVKPHIAELGQVPDTDTYRNINRFDGLNEQEDILIVRYDAQLYFANLQYFRDQLDVLIKNKGDKLKCIILNTECINSIDSSGIKAIGDWNDELLKRGLEIYFAEIKGPLRDIFYRSGLTDKIGEERFFLSVQNAVDFYRSPETVVERRAKMRPYTLQNNEK
ncbi:MAG: SulP family inorganic anion transporter [Bacteroidia bacterium]